MQRSPTGDGKKAPTPSAPKKRISAQFNADDFDITIQSADDVLYRVHRKNLECASEVVPPSEFKSDRDDIIPMTEASRILDLLFVFIYPQPTPNIANLPFETLSELAEAAEKYRIFSAMTIWNIYMRFYTLVAIQMPFDAVITKLKLSPNVATAWLCYYHDWLRALLSIQERHANGCFCSAWPRECLAVLDKMGGKVESLSDLDRIFTPSKKCCSGCSRHVGIWREQASKIIADLPAFSVYLFTQSSDRVWLPDFANIRRRKASNMDGVVWVAATIVVIAVLYRRWANCPCVSIPSVAIPQSICARVVGPWTFLSWGEVDKYGIYNSCRKKKKVKSEKSERFNWPDADITFQSIDSVQYRIHRKNLECAAAGFPAAEFECKNDEIVPMPEHSEVLDLLFSFMYPERQPSLKKISFRVMADLAEAAEKYEVFAAMATCHTHMTAEIEKHSLAVLVYAAKHDYPELLDKSAMMVIGQPLDSVVDRMPPAVAVVWIRYYQKWRDFLVLQLHNGPR
ncbi:hypothetical protein APHAL10511_008706 [Amanita phalloides]|nr:hypothetical protein APHAL10511_008706 [Amanita phalloides]